MVRGESTSRERFKPQEFKPNFTNNIRNSNHKGHRSFGAMAGDFLQSLGSIVGALGGGWRCKHCNQWSNEYTGNILDGTSRCPNCGLDPNPFIDNGIADAPTESGESENESHGANAYTPPSQTQASAVEDTSRSTWTRTQKFGTKPLLRELQVLRGQNGMTVRVVETAAHSWKAVAMALGFSGAQIRTIERDYLNRSEDACREVFIKWLDGEAEVSSPLTWDTLIERLEEARLDELAESLKHCLSQRQ